MVKRPSSEARATPAVVFTILLSIDEEAALIFDIGFAIQPFRSRLSVSKWNGRIVVSALQVEKCADARIGPLS